MDQDTRWMTKYNEIMAFMAELPKGMKDYPDRMKPEEARRFGENVLDIVSQIPRGKVTTLVGIEN